MDNQDQTQSDISKKEETILSFWNEKKIFEQSVTKEASNGSFVFFDGPPFGTGVPHYGHLLAGTIKDVFPRYETMRGKSVRRKWGWDCHGLPVENLIEKKLNLQTKKDIELFGIDNFNREAKNSVLEFAHEWERIVPRSGRFIDMVDDYKTMDTTYTESIWWAFKTLFDKELIYQGYYAMQLCPRCETTLSNFEVSQGYKDITDISVYAKFELLDEPGTYVIAWTTTPWTLPGNVALAVGSEIQYVKIEVNGVLYILAKERLSVLKQEYSIVDHHVSLVGRAYRPIFDFYAKDISLPNRDNGWKIYSAPFVTLDAGTGIVHIAPAFGDDDMKLGKSEQLPFIQHVGTDGIFKDDFVTGMKGLHVKPKDNHQSTDIEIIKWLAHNNFLFEKEKIVHSYPHCWRCDTPLLNYASGSWFVQATALKEKLIKANKQITWVPDHIQEGRFGNWLENVRDWAISRSRYWGAPIPVWQSQDKEEFFVAGSIHDITSRTQKSGNTYVVMRHGQTDHNVRAEWNCDRNKPDPLTETGVQQVVDQARQTKEHFDYIFTSPFSRTKETARIFVETQGAVTEIIEDERLREWFVGVEYDGRPFDDYFAIRNASSDRYTFKTHDGESYVDVLIRAGEFMYELESKYANKRILIVSHGAVSRAIELHAKGLTYQKRELLAITDGYVNFGNAEMRVVNFSPFPHNETYQVDLHRPYIDTYKVLDTKGNPMNRVPEVFDCWFESGAMPFAQLHYPFENNNLFEKNYPADFIAEGIDQTRGWFYSLLVLGVGLFDEAPYKRVVVNGMILAEDGKKMSKKLKNYPDIDPTIAKYGADALRMYLLSLPSVRGEESRFIEKDLAQLSSRVLGRLRNVFSFYLLYRDINLEKTIDQATTVHVLDSWILSRLYQTIRHVEGVMEAYHLDHVIRCLDSFVDDISTWYLRRSRERIKNGEQDAKETLYHVLKTTAVVFAPFAPFVAEEIWQVLKQDNDVESVHLADWPPEGHVANSVLDQMQKTRDYVTLGLEARQQAGVKVRQPLVKLFIRGESLEKSYEDLVLDEVNVKELICNVDLTEATFLDTEITPELKSEGIVREFMRTVQDLRKKQGLEPSDSIVLIVAVAKEGKDLLEQYSKEVLKTVGAESLEFIESADDYVNIEGIDFSITFRK